MASQEALASLLASAQSLHDRARALETAPNADAGNVLELRREALTTLGVAQQISPENPQVNVFLGDVLFDLGRFDQARAKFVRAATADPKDVHARYGAGLSLFRLADNSSPQADNYLEKAAGYLEATAEEWPWSEGAWSAWALSLRQLGENRATAEVYLRAADVRPGHEWPLSAAQLFAEMGDHELAASQYKQAAERLASTPGADAQTWIDIQTGLATELIALRRYRDLEDEAAAMINRLAALQNPERVEQDAPGRDYAGGNGAARSVPEQSVDTGILLQRTRHAKLLRGAARLGLKRYEESLSDLHEAGQEPGLVALLALRLRAQ